MNKDDCQEFVKAFKIAVNNCSIYPHGHLIFSRSVESFKNKIDRILPETGSLTVKVGPELLIVCSQPLEGKAIYKELASFLHKKKIKSITFARGVGIRELSDFFIILGANFENILSEGGFNKILEAKKIKNIKVSELDYSRLIKGRGEHLKDVWGYLFSLDWAEAFNGKEAQELAGFREKLSKAGIKEVLEDKFLSGQLMTLFTRLQSNPRLDSKKIIKKLGEVVLTTKDLKKIENREEMKNLFSKLKSEDLADLLMQISESKAVFSQTSFDLFSILIPLERHEEAAEILKEEFNREKPAVNFSKIKKVFMPLEGESASIYKKHLSEGCISQDMKAKFDFDFEQLKKNYRLLLFDLFFYETDLQKLSLIIKEISYQVRVDFPEKKEYILQFWEIYSQKDSHAKFAPLSSLAQKIWAQIEGEIFHAEENEKLSFLPGTLEESSLGPDFYLKKISEGNFNFLIFKLFLKFFPDQLIRLQEEIISKKNKPSFFNRAIDILEKIDYSATFKVLKKYYDSGPLQAKIEVLDRLKKYPECPGHFFIDAAASQSFYLRKKAVEAAFKFPSSYKAIARGLLSFPNFFGVNTKKILENLSIIEEFYRLEARPYLEKTRHYRFFWNRKIRRKSYLILKFNNGKSN